MKTRIITAFALILVLVPIMYYCGIAFTALSTVFGFLAGYEIVRLFNDRCPKWLRTVIPVIFAASALAMNYLGKYMLPAVCVLIWHSTVRWKYSHSFRAIWTSLRRSSSNTARV